MELSAPYTQGAVCEHISIIYTIPNLFLAENLGGTGEKSSCPPKDPPRSGQSMENTEPTPAGTSAQLPSPRRAAPSLPGASALRKIPEIPVPTSLPHGGKSGLPSQGSKVFQEMPFATWNFFPSSFLLSFSNSRNGLKKENPRRVRLGFLPLCHEFGAPTTLCT